MAGTGPLPKMQRQRERDTRRREGEFTTVKRTKTLYGPTLKAATGRADWPDDVVRWYDDWRRSPQAELFEVTDWRRLALAAVLVESYYRKPSAAALSELRMIEAQLGATWGDRLKARIRVTDEADADVVPLHPVPSGAATARAAWAAEGDDETDDEAEDLDVFETGDDE